jgi:hypothetical protein
MSSPNLRNVRNFDSLIRYLEDELGWPLDGYEMEDLTFDYEPSDLGLKEEEAAKVKSIRQLRPLTSSQPWGIFFIEFDKKQLPVVVLRRILSHLVLKKRASANAADAKRWSAQDLLFVSAFGPEDADGREIGFAHFHEESGDLPSLRVLGWDGDNTALTLQRVASTLKDRLRWPEKGETSDAWRQRWSGAFKHRPGHIIRTSDLLAEALAALAKRIRDAARTLMEHETERGPLRTLHKAFQTNLIHDLDENGFADTYAQTITYGLLTAAINRTDMTGGRHGTFVKADDVALAIKPTSPFLKEMLETFLKVGGRKGHMDFDELGVQDVVELLRSDVTDIPAILADFGNKTRGEDPVIHFYEHFLNAYNKKLKVQRGVFYTPQAVVGYIVRSVHELLQTEFGLEDGLASTVTWGEMIQKNPSLQLPLKVEGNPAQGPISENEPFVQILDPATGTATFLVETIEVIHRTLKAKWQAQRLSVAQQRDVWNEYVPNHLLPRLHGYELMMAPYAIAHMKIGLKLTELGYNFASDARAQIYLTNALEPWQQQLPLIGFDALAHEAAAVNEVKRHKRFTVVIGNPPYSDASQNMGEWTAPLIEPFRFYQQSRIKERGAIRFEHCINNDYVKFWGLTLALINQSPLALAALITSNTFLGGKSFRGVRDAMVGKVTRVEILDLHGEGWAGDLAKQGIKDENVFEITTGVAITSLVKPLQNQDVANVFHREITGTYEYKARLLTGPKLPVESTQVVLDPHHYFPFTPQGGVGNDEYWTWPQVDTLFKASVDGIKTSRDGLVIANTREACRQKILNFAESNAGIDDIESEFSISGKSFDIRGAQRHLKRHFDENLIHPILYRPFDIRYIYYDKELILSHRMNVMPSMFHKRAWSLVFASRLSSKGFDHVIACAALCAHKCASHDINSRMFPVVGLFSPLLGQEQLMSNLSDVLLETMPKGNADTEAARASEIGEYLYAVFNAPSYRSRYHESISQDFPRVPLTNNSELFGRLCELGRALVNLHTLS